jgi:hypothetical protein
MSACVLEQLDMDNSGGSIKLAFLAKLFGENIGGRLELYVKQL